MPDRSERPAAALDPSALQALEDDVGADDVADLVALVLADAPRQAAELAAAIERADRDGAARAAHTLKSLAALIGAPELREQCRVLEELARAGRIDAAALRRPAADAELAAVLEALRWRV